VKRPATDRAFSDRVERRIEAASIFATALDATTTSRPVVAAQFEVSRQDIDKICDPTTGRAVPLDHVLGLKDVDPASYRKALDLMAARDGLVVTDLPSAGEMGDDFRAIAAAQRESADVVARGLDALADGRMCAREGAELAAECDEAIAALLAIRERARLAQREGVIGLVRKVGAA
jgi:hypothetical protein